MSCLKNVPFYYLSKKCPKVLCLKSVRLKTVHLKCVRLKNVAVPFLTTCRFVTSLMNEKESKDFLLRRNNEKLETWEEDSIVSEWVCVCMIVCVWFGLRMFVFMYVCVCMCVCVCMSVHVFECNCMWVGASLQLEMWWSKIIKQGKLSTNKAP